MAQLTFPIVARELLVDVRVNLHAPALIALQAAQQPAPPFFVGKAILDTGSNISGVSAAVIRQFALVRYAQSNTSGIGGTVPVDLYHASLNICDVAQPHIPGFMQPDLVVMELPPATPVDVLIGMDVLLGCRLLIDGPNNLFTLDY